MGCAYDTGKRLTSAGKTDLAATLACDGADLVAEYDNEASMPPCLDRPS